MHNRYHLLISLALLASLSACDAKLNVNIPKPSPSPSASPSPTTSASPTTQPSASPSDTPTAVPSASASNGDGKLVVIGSDVFAKYNVDYHAGQKWVYKMTLKGLSIALPAGLPAGISIPGASGDTDLGEMMMEVLKVEGSMVTIKSTITSSLAPGKIPPSTKTFDKSDKTALAKIYVESQNNGTEGTATWTAGGSESVTVPAGTYTADRINGVFDITTDNGNGVRAKLDQTAKLWFANNVGMVKEEVLTKIMTSGTSSDSTTVIELKSVTG